MSEPKYNIILPVFLSSVSSLLLLLLSTMKFKTFLTSFVVGSSLLGSLFSYYYIGYANYKKKGIKDYEFVSFAISLYYGLFNALNVMLLTRYNLPFTSYIIGGLQGVLFSIYGRFMYDNLPVKMFGFPKDKSYMVHPTAFFYYGLVYILIINRFNKYFDLI